MAEAPALKTTLEQLCATRKFPIVSREVAERVAKLGGSSKRAVYECPYCSKFHIAEKAS